MSSQSEAGTRSGAGAPRIVVGVDGSDTSDRALDWAAHEADVRGAVLDIHTFYEPGYTHITAEEVQRTMDRIVARAADRVAGEAPGAVTTTHTHEAAPAEGLIDAARDADLLVVGSRGLGGFSGLLLGSVSHKCVLHAPCSVAVIR